MSAYTMNAKEWALLVLLAVIWGANFFFIEVALVGLSPLMIVFLRMAMAAVLMLIYLHATGHRLPREWKLWKAFVVLGLLNSLVPFLLITWGQTHIESGLAAILNATTPIFSVILTHFLTDDEKMTGNRVVGVILGMMGVCLLIGPEALSGFSFEALGQFAILGATTCYAYGAIRTRLLKDKPVLIVMTCTLCAASLMLLPFILIFELPLQLEQTGSVIVAVLYLAIIGTAAGHLIFYYVISRVGANNTLLVAFLVPITALLLGTFILGEKLSGLALIGMFIIFISLIVIDGRFLRRVVT